MRRILAIIAVIFAGQAYSQQGQSGAGNNQSQDNAAEEIIIRSDALDSIEQSINRIAANTTPDEEAQRQQENREIINTGLVRLDLNAQESMADSTVWIMRLSFVAVLFTGIGLWMIWRTLRYTRDAATSTKKTLGIAEQTLATTKNSNLIQNRAYIAPLSQSVFFERSELGGYWKLKIEWGNLGNTPAYNVRYGCCMLLYDPVVEDIPIVEAIPISHITPRYIASNRSDDPSFFLPTALTTDDWTEKRDGFLFIQMAVIYEDVFRRTYRYDITGYWTKYSNLTVPVGDANFPIQIFLIGFPQAERLLSDESKQ